MKHIVEIREIRKIVYIVEDDGDYINSEQCERIAEANYNAYDIYKEQLKVAEPEVEFETLGTI